MKLAVALAALLVGAPPVASAPGLVVASGGRVYVEGRAVAKGGQPVWSKDGLKLAYVRDGGVFVARRDGRQARRVATGGQPSWSPDGGRIVFIRGLDVYTVRVADGKVARLTRSAHPWIGANTPAYSPDGRTIAFSRSTDAFNSDIFLMRADGGGVRRLTRTQGSDGKLGEEHGPTWSPDGRRIVFVSNRDRNFELYSIGADGRGERRLTRTRVDEDLPRLSRAGSRVLFVRAGRVASMKADGSDVRVLGAGDSADWR